MKKTLLISLIAGLFLAFTACGKDDKGTPSDTAQSEEASSHTVSNGLLAGRLVTVASGDFSKTIDSGYCVEVPESKLEGLVVSSQWKDQVLCGGESDEAVACADRDVKVVPNADFTGVEFADSDFSGCEKNVLGEEPEEAAAAEGADGGACKADEENKCDEGLTCNDENKCEAEVTTE